MVTERDRRRIEALRADQATVREAAQWVRDQAGGNVAALSDPRTAELGGELLELMADELAGMPDSVRGHTVRVCRDLLGRPMDRPTVRRTRRR